MERVRNRLSSLQKRLAEILQARAASVGKSSGLALKVENEIKTLTEQRGAALTEKLEAQRVEALQKRRATEEFWNRRATNIRSALARRKAGLDKQIRDRRASWMERRKEAQAKAVQDHRQALLELDRQHAKRLEFLENLATFSTELKARVENFARERGVRLGSLKPEPVDESAIDEANETATKLNARLEGVEQKLEASQKLGPLIPPIAAYAIVLAVHAAVWYALFKTTFVPACLLVIMSFGFFIWLAYTLCSKAKDKVREVGTEMVLETLETTLAIQREKVREKHRNMTDVTTLGVERAQLDAEEGEKFNQMLNDYNKPQTEALTKLQSRCDALLETITLRKATAIQRVENEANQTSAALKAEHDAALKKKREEGAAILKAAEDEKNNARETLAASWKAELAACDAFVKETQEKFAASHPAWNAMSARDMQLPNEFANEVPIGNLNLDLKALAPQADDHGAFSLETLKTASLPMFLSFPLQGSMLIKTQGNRRNESLGLVFNTLLNLLRSFPPSKVKLTIIDPVGLGQNFAGLMHLADYDETLVNGRIWSEGVHIERKLTELTEHMEKVIQKYLRNRYKTIEEYNREAGQMAEPYKFLIIGDFPASFSELALERLASIIKSGVRCGVYTIILHNERQHKIPPQIDLSELKKNGFVIRDRGDGFVVEDDVLSLVQFKHEEPPSAEQIDLLVNAIGKQCREAARVQVPFEIVMPKAEDYWTSSTQSSVRIPLGKAGADRLQYMELGRGTAQHALIAGKTGSGKSNLFHVIVTNAASWYSPREMEFYLIDFKKGVEFKTYGTHRLRHARVVAIESDREFAISVLRRIDLELTNRGELFRKARVQDFPSFRKASPEAVMPRTLLLIDEFQEFFVDDDSVAQEAALLLDRIVRQGRAFGIHVVLGSQTLGGTYTLSKSTLGQVGVRIALACNESDSYLVLSDDNAAASLLTRPGEAIYNDQAGAVEGNNPFQAVYLPKDSQDKYLEVLQRKAVEGGMENVEPIVVFEGSSLADLRNNMLLRDAALNATKMAMAAPKIWLGDPNAIKGPTEIEFGRQAGSNLVVVGHRGDTEVSMACASVLSLAAEFAPKDVAVKILDGTRPDSPARERLLQLAKALPHEIEIVDYRGGGEMIAGLVKEMKARQDQSAEAAKHVFFMVIGLEKFRMLRQEDEFSFSSKEDDGVSPAQGFTDLLLEGPNAGIHSMVWCDTLGNLNRSLSRKTLREFEMRVLFQMSASDSSELVDSPAANRLGMYNALFFSAQSGQIEKFRPYSTPDKELIGEFGRMISARETRVASGAKS